MVGRQRKKPLAKDPRISVPEKKTECYIFRETPVSAEDEILEQFNDTRSARRRIALAEDLIAAVGQERDQDRPLAPFSMASSTP